MKYLILLLFPVLLFSQVVDENFEGTGTPASWTVTSGTPNFDYTPAILQTQSMSLPSGSLSDVVSPTFAAQDSLHVFFTAKFSDATPTAAVALLYFQSGVTPKILVYLWTTGKLRIGSTYSTTTLLDNTTYFIWLDNIPGSGANGIQRAYISTTPTKPASPEINITNSNTTGTLDNIRFYNAATTASQVIIDKVYASASVIGTLAPVTPYGLSPADAATSISVTPTLSCTDQVDADSFYFKISPNADLTSAVYDTMVNTNSLAVSLDYITQYYWLAGAWNAGDTTLTDTVSFTTKKLETATTKRDFGGYTKFKGFKK